MLSLLLSPVRLVCAPRDGLPPPICLYRPMGNRLEPWLRRVLTRRWLDRCRRRRLFLPLTEEVLGPEAPLTTSEERLAALNNEPFSAPDLNCLETWGVRDRIELLCLTPWWGKIAQHYPERWESWLQEYGSQRGFRLERPFSAC